MSQKYAVRHPTTGERVYEVYVVATGETFKRFPYGRGEKARGVAHGRANLTRRAFNDAEMRKSLGLRTLNEEKTNAKA